MKCWKKKRCIICYLIRLFRTNWNIFIKLRPRKRVEKNYKKINYQPICIITVYRLIGVSFFGKGFFFPLTTAVLSSIYRLHSEKATHSIGKYRQAIYEVHILLAKCQQEKKLNWITEMPLTRILPLLLLSKQHPLLLLPLLYPVSSGCQFVYLSIFSLFFFFYAAWSLHFYWWKQFLFCSQIYLYRYTYYSIFFLMTKDREGVEKIERRRRRRRRGMMSME